MPESHHILSLCDTIGALDLADHIERGPGRHGVSNAFYVYLRDDDGHRVEIYTSDYFTGDPDHEPLRWDVHDERRRDFWANPVVPGWYLGSAPILDLDGQPVAIVEQEPTERSVTVGADGLGTVVHRPPASRQPERADVETTAPPTGCPVDHTFDPLAPDYLLDPYPVAARVRESTPVFYAPALDMWVVSRMDDVEAVFSDHETFSGRIVQDPMFPVCPAARAVLSEGFHPLPVMSNNEPPDHGRIRVHTTKGFSNRRMAILEPFIRANAERLIGAMLAGDPPAEFVQAVAFPLPAYTVFRHIGFPDEDAEPLKRWCGNRKLFQWGRATEAEQVEIADNMVAYWHYCQAFTDAKLDHLADDFASDLLRAHLEDPEQLTLDEVKSVVYGLSFAGHEAVTNLLCNTVRQLLTHRDQWEAVCADPDARHRRGRGGAALRLQPDLLATDHHEAGDGRRRRGPRRGQGAPAVLGRQPGPSPLRRPGQLRHPPGQRPEPHQLRQGHPLLPRRRHGPPRGPDRARHARPHGAVAPPGRRPGLPGLPQHHLPRSRTALAGVVVGRTRNRRLLGE